MLARAIQEQRRGERIFTVWGSGATIRECLYVDDQIDAILAADAHFENTIVNCTANRPVTIAEIAYSQGTYSGTSKKVLDSGRFLEATGFTPRIGLEEGLRRLARELLERLY